MNPLELNEFIVHHTETPSVPIKPKKPQTKGKGKGKAYSMPIEPAKPKKAIAKKPVQKKAAVKKLVVDKKPAAKRASSKTKYVKKTPADIPNEAWKFFRSRFALIFHMCRDCNSNLYKDKSKYEQSGEHHIAKVRMCTACAMANLTLQNVYYMAFESEKKQKT